MLALDTNVLVRVLVDDPTAPEQCRAARQMVSEAGEVSVSQIVQIETTWVLAGAYGITRPALCDVLEKLAAHPAFHLQRLPIFLAALQHLVAGHADFADCMILAESADAGCELATFDRKLARLPGTRLVK
jgi:predicted nucleic-acid-binding protein